MRKTKTRHKIGILNPKGGGTELANKTGYHRPIKHIRGGIFGIRARPTP